MGPAAVEVVGRGGVGVVVASLQAEAPAAEYVPAGQKRQMTSEFAPIVAEYLPALQSVHPALPVTILYFPAAQAEHVPPLGPVKPRLQTQLLDAVEPLTDCELLGQAIQVLLARAPTTVEYVLTPQFKHMLREEAPVVVEYLPMGQKVQASEPAELLYVPAAQLTQFPPLRVIPGAHSGPPQYMRRSYVIRFCCEINCFCTLQYMATIASTDNKSTFIRICKSSRWFVLQASSAPPMKNLSGFDTAGK
jgi:hypothetical protein